MKTIIFIIALVIFLVFGFISNIVSLVKCDFSAPYKCEIIRTVGVFIPPVGVITGYISIND